MPLIIDEPAESIDIDSEWDWKLAEAFLAANGPKSKHLTVIVCFIVLVSNREAHNELEYSFFFCLQCLRAAGVRLHC